jgi:hypothetical protein
MKLLTITALLTSALYLVGLDSTISTLFASLLGGLATAMVAFPSSEYSSSRSNEDGPKIDWSKVPVNGGR